MQQSNEGIKVKSKAQLRCMVYRTITRVKYEPTKATNITKHVSFTTMSNNVKIKQYLTRIGKYLHYKTSVLCI